MATTLGFNGGSQDTDAVVAPQGGRNWLQEASARLDPMMSFLWDVDIVFPSQLLQVSPALPMSMIEDIQLPLSRFDVDNVYYQGQRFYYAKFEEYSPVSIKFYEDRAGTTTTFFQNWKQLIRNGNGDFGYPIDYQATCTIYPLDQANIRILDIVLTGFFPIGFGNLAFTSAAGRQELTMEFQISNINIFFAQGEQVLNTADQMQSSPLFFGSSG